jgi:hypothetical protein
VDSLAANNTIINPDVWLMRILQETVSDTTYEFLPSGDNSVINNLFYFGRGELSTYLNIGPNTAPETFTFANNLWYAHDNPAQSTPTLPVTETGGIYGSDPLFISVPSGNYHLQSGSPAIGQGLPFPGIAFDYDGLPYNNPPSIGAFEGNWPDYSDFVFLPSVIK